MAMTALRVSWSTHPLDVPVQRDDGTTFALRCKGGCCGQSVSEDELRALQPAQLDMFEEADR